MNSKIERFLARLDTEMVTCEVHDIEHLDGCPLCLVLTCDDCGLGGHGPGTSDCPLEVL